MATHRGLAARAAFTTKTRRVVRQYLGPKEVHRISHKALPMPPKSWVARGYNVQRWTTFSIGGHFAAAEEPKLLTQDIR